MTRIDHVALWTEDLDRLATFYATYFGASAGPRYANPAKGFASRFLVFAEGARIELMTSTVVAPARQARGAQRMGLTHVAIGVGADREVDVLTGRLRQDGFEVIDGPRRTGDGYYESVVLDPDGNRVEIAADTRAPAAQAVAFDRLILDTARLRLRPLQPADAAALFAICSDPVVMRYWSCAPWTSVATAEEMIARDRRAMPAGEYLRLGIEVRDTARLIGFCTLFAFAPQCRRAEIGYGMARAAWGRGYMHEALVALLDHGFGALALNRVEADIDPRNLASAGSLERLGFRKEGSLRERWIVDGEVSDSSLYGLLRSDWRSGSTP